MNEEFSTINYVLGILCILGGGALLLAFMFFGRDILRTIFIDGPKRILDTIAMEASAVILPTLLLLAVLLFPLFLLDRLLGGRYSNWLIEKLEKARKRGQKQPQ